MTNYSPCLENGAVSGDSSEVHDLTPDRNPPPLVSSGAEDSVSTQACTGVRKDKDEPFPADRKSEVPFANFAN